MTYTEQVNAAASATAAQVLAAVAAYQAGQITADTLVAVVAAYIAAGNGTAAAIADLSLAAVLSVDLTEPIAPLGIVRPDYDPERLATAARTLLDNDADLARWERLVLAETRKAAADAYSEGMRKSSHVTGWVRQLDADPCQLCRWWYREGRVWPDDHPMPTHTGCECFPRPVTVNRPIKPVVHH